MMSDQYLQAQGLYIRIHFGVDWFKIPASRAPLPKLGVSSVQNYRYRRSNNCRNNGKNTVPLVFRVVIIFALLMDQSN